MYRMYRVYRMYRMSGVQKRTDCRICRMYKKCIKFFPKPKRFGCFVAAVLLILSPKELI